MTYPFYRQGDNWYQCFKDVPNNKPDETIYIELSDSLYWNHPISMTKKELLAFKNAGNYYTGMHGLKQRMDWISSAAITTEK